MKNSKQHENAAAPAERRGFTRLNFAHPVRWSHAAGDCGEAVVRNISRGGLRVSLGQYFRPGQLVDFEFEGIRHRGEPVRFEALIAWCHPVPTQPERFDVGFRIIYDNGERVAAVSEVVYRALEFRAPAAPRADATIDCGCLAH